MVSSTTQSVIDSSSNHIEKRWKGVRKRSWGRWVCEIRLPRSRQRIWLGSYGTAQEAACAYDAASLCLRGSAASLNFPCSSISSILPASSSQLPLTREAIQSIAAAAAAQCRNPQADDAAAMVERRCSLSACDEGMPVAGRRNYVGEMLPYVQGCREWVSHAMARMTMKGQIAAPQNDAEPVPPPPPRHQATSAETRYVGADKSSSAVDEEQCMFSNLKDLEPLPKICSSLGTSIC